MGKKKNSLKRLVVTSGFVTTMTIMSCSHMQETVVPEIMTGILYVVITIIINIRGIGMVVKNVGMKLKQKCMFIMERMSTISENLRIHQNMNLLNVVNAGKLLNWRMEGILWGRKGISVGIVGYSLIIYDHE